MSVLCNDDGSESDVSSNSSWSVLLESDTIDPTINTKITSSLSTIRDRDQTPEEFVQVQGNDDIKCPDLFLMTPNHSETSLVEVEVEDVEKNANNMSLVPCTPNFETVTLRDEELAYMKQRQIVECDVFEQWKRDFSNDKRRKSNKHKKEIKSIFALMITFLLVAGLTFACMLWPTVARYGAMETRHINSLVQSAQVQNHPQSPPPELTMPKYPPMLEKFMKSLEDRKNQGVPKHGWNEVKDKFTVKKVDSDDTAFKADGPIVYLGPISKQDNEKSKLKRPSSDYLHTHKPRLNKFKSPELKCSVDKNNPGLKKTENCIFGEIKNIGNRITRRIYRVFSPALSYLSNNTTGEESTGKYNGSGIFHPTNLYLAIHILNDLVLLKIAGYIKKDLHRFRAKLTKLTKRKKKSKRISDKDAKAKGDLTGGDATIEKSKALVMVAKTKSKKPALQPKKHKGEKLSKKADNNTITYIDFFKDLQNIKKKKIEYFKSLDIKSKRDFIKEDKAVRAKDNYNLNTSYIKTMPCKETRDQLIFCLTYLQSRKRDMETINKMRNDETDTKKNILQMEKLRKMETEIINHFKNKNEFINNGRIALSKKNLEIPYIVDILLARQTRLKLRRKLGSRDASTERYVVPITSISKMSNANVCWASLSKPRKIYDNVNDKTNENNVNEKLSDKADYCKNKMKSLTVQNFASEEYRMNTERKDNRDVLKSWKDKYEQLKLFWKSRQEYYDKRIEICHLIKNVMPPIVSNNTSLAGCSGARVLDNMIKDVVHSSPTCCNTNVSRTTNRNEIRCTDSIISTSNDVVDNVFNEIKMIFRNDLMPDARELRKSTCSSIRKYYDRLVDHKVKQLQCIPTHWKDDDYECNRCCTCSCSNAHQ